MNLVTIHLWNYGIDLWTEVEFEGDGAEKLKAILGRPTVDSSIVAARNRVVNGLRRYGTDLCTLPEVVVSHHEERKRRPSLAPHYRLVETSGEFEQHGVSARYGGACPVQGHGLIDGHPFYYRARGRGWEIQVFAKHAVLDEDDWPEPIFLHRERPYAHPDGGWLESSESKLNILRAAETFRARNQEIKCEPTP